MIRTLCAALLLLSGFASAVHAADPQEMPAPSESPPPSAMPAPSESAAPQPGEAGPVVPAGELAEEAPPQRPADVSYGIATRLRWVTVPSWMLNLFTEQNVPLSSWGTGFEMFRRKANFDLVWSVSYQNMSPPPGNWLGKSHPADIDTDYVILDGVALWATDISFVWHTNFNDWFGMHYGAGVGIAYVSGDVLRISNGVPRNPDGSPGTGPNACTDANAGNINACYPSNVTPNGSDTLPINRPVPLTDVPDTNQNPRLFRDTNKPPVLPIVNLLIGVNFRLPQVRGWEARIEGGFYNAFFLGGAIGYTF